jgi:hypothetical protein
LPPLWGHNDPLQIRDYAVSRIAQAQRLKRAFSLDIGRCPSCGGAVRIIACIDEPEVIEKILIHLDKKGAAQETGLLPEGQTPPAGRL